MSILTKVFVVLVTFLSVAVMALVISFSANTENYKDKYQAEKDLRKTAEVLANVAQAENNRLQDHDRETKINHANALKLVNDQNTALKNSLFAEQTKVQNLEVESNTLQADLSRISLLNGQLTSMKEGADVELGKLRQRSTDQARQLVELSEANAELTAERDAQEGIAKRGAERIAQLEQEYEELNSLVTKIPQDVINEALGTGKTQAAVEDWLPGVAGKVVRVTEKGGEIWIELNIGTNDKVREGAWFMVSRGETYLGDLIVDSVDVNASAGRIRNPSAASGGIKVGDNAVSSPGS